MSSPPSSSEAASSFELLDEKVQHWIYKQQWNELRGIQKRSITPVLDRSQDLIVAAATAAGKTEAAFLPILTSLRRAPTETGVGALYIAPLKALINDQHQRLDLLCEACGVALTSWHGDIGAEPKRKLLAHPSGILLITPESLESIFVNHGSSVPAIFGALRYVVIDELHAFIGSERGRQMQSLLHRIECAGKIRAMRIGLSATLGEMAPAADFLRPGHGAEVDIIESTDDARTLMVQLRGYVAEPPPSGIEPTPDDLPVDGDRLAIADHIYANLRGADNLVFANSRKGVEEFADLLRRRCEAERVPTEFFPHHGSLSKALERKSRSGCATPPGRRRRSAPRRSSSGSMSGVSPASARSTLRSRRRRSVNGSAAVADALRTPRYYGCMSPRADLNPGRRPVMNSAKGWCNRSRWSRH